MAKTTHAICLPVANEITFGEKEIAEKGTHNSFEINDKLPPPPEQANRAAKRVPCKYNPHRHRWLYLPGANAKMAISCTG